MELTYIFDGNEFTYTPSDEEVNECIYEAFSDDYKLDDFQTKQIIEDFDLRDKMIEAYEDYIKDCCEYDAREAYKESKVAK